MTVRSAAEGHGTLDGADRSNAKPQPQKGFNMEDKANLHPGTPTLTVAEVGELFGLKPYTLHKWRKSGNGPLMIREKREIVNFLGKPQTLLVWVCPIDELRAWMKEHRPAQVVALDKLLSERAEG